MTDTVHIAKIEAILFASGEPVETERLSAACLLPEAEIERLAGLLSQRLDEAESGLMLPQKSVTAIIGISDKPQKHRSGSCMGCNMYLHCIYRKEGRTCDKH